MGENEILEDKITNVELEQDESEYEEELDENVLQAAKQDIELYENQIEENMKESQQKKESTVKNDEKELKQPKFNCYVNQTEGLYEYDCHIDETFFQNIFNSQKDYQQNYLDIKQLIQEVKSNKNVQKPLQIPDDLEEVNIKQFQSQMNSYNKPVQYGKTHKKLLQSQQNGKKKKYINNQNYLQSKKYSCTKDYTLIQTSNEKNTDQNEFEQEVLI